MYPTQWNDKRVLCILEFMIKMMKYPTPYIYVCIIIILGIPSNVSFKIATETCLILLFK